MLAIRPSTVIILLFTNVPIKHVVPKHDIISMFTVAYAFLYIDVVRSLELVVYLFFIKFIKLNKMNFVHDSRPSLIDCSELEFFSCLHILIE